jgi:hypothetical protein
MSLSKSKYWYSNNCLHFLKNTVPLSQLLIANCTTTIWNCYEQAAVFGLHCHFHNLIYRHTSQCNLKYQVIFLGFNDADKKNIIYFMFKFLT